jgi:hypothetical protein
MSTSTPKVRTPRGARVAQIAGIVGIVICVAIIVGTWLGGGFVRGKVDDLSTGVNNGISRAGQVADTVATRLDDAAAKVGTLAQNATEVAANPSAPDALTGLADRYAQFYNAYQDFRARYAEAKENLVSAITSLQRVASFLPGVNAPDPPGVLPAIDQKLQAIDDALTAALPQPGQPTAATATAIATAATAVQGLISDVATSVRGLKDDLANVQAKANSTLDTIRNLILVLSIAVTVLLVWVLILNFALWHLGRVWKREAKMLAAADAAAGGAASSPGGAGSTDASASTPAPEAQSPA